MITTLRTDLTVEDLCEGFVYSEIEDKGLFGWNGKLVIQPEYQRHYIYNDGVKDVAVVDSLLKGYPLGLLYFVKTDENKYEILDGQQRVTSFARFVKNKFAIRDMTGTEQYYSGLPQDQKDKIRNSKLTIYICEGEETEIKEWFKTINITGVPLKEQELRNSIHSGPFVTLAKKTFSNRQNANIQKWGHYLKGEVNRQDYLETALEWVSHDHIDEYMSLHRFDNNITELETYFNTVIDWASGIFDVYDQLKGLEWGRLYEAYHNFPYDINELNERVKELLDDPFVSDKKGIFEFMLGGGQQTQLLNVRVFNDAIKRQVYNKQTEAAEKKGKSNCPLCAVSRTNAKTKIYKLNEMDADHVTAWSKGGATDIKNCQMLCKTHNKAKGNR